MRAPVYGIRTREIMSAAASLLLLYDYPGIVMIVCSPQGRIIIFAAAVLKILWYSTCRDTSRTNTFQCSCEERVHMVGDHVHLTRVSLLYPGIAFSARAFLPVVLDRQSMTANGVRA